MFEGLCILVPRSCSIVDNEKFSLFLSRPHHNILRFYLVVDKIFEVEVLQDGDEFLSKHERCLLGEGASTQMLEFLQ